MDEHAESDHLWRERALTVGTRLVALVCVAGTILLVLLASMPAEEPRDAVCDATIEWIVSPAARRMLIDHELWPTAGAAREMDLVWATKADGTELAVDCQWADDGSSSAWRMRIATSDETCHAAADFLDRSTKTYVTQKRRAVDRLADSLDEKSHLAVTAAKRDLAAAETEASVALERLVLARAQHAARANMPPLPAVETERTVIVSAPPPRDSDAEIGLRKLEERRAELLARLTPAHPMVVELEQELQAAATAYAASANQVAPSIDVIEVRPDFGTQPRAAEPSSSEALMASAAEVANAEMEYGRRQADWRVARDACDEAMQAQVAAAESAASLRAVEIRCERTKVESASSNPDGVRLARYGWWQWSLVLSLVVGAAVAWGVGVEQPETIDDAHMLERLLAAPVLGVLTWPEGARPLAPRRLVVPTICWCVVFACAAMLAAAFLAACWLMAARDMSAVEIAASPRDSAAICVAAARQAIGI